jgi:hypothetical protein
MVSLGENMRKSCHGKEKFSRPRQAWLVVGLLGLLSTASWKYKTISII